MKGVLSYNLDDHGCWRWGGCARGDIRMKVETWCDGCDRLTLTTDNGRCDWCSSLVHSSDGLTARGNLDSTRVAAGIYPERIRRLRRRGLGWDAIGRSCDTGGTQVRYWAKLKVDSRVHPDTRRRMGVAWEALGR